MRTTRAERTGWRDERISERHRHWGFNCPAVDLDFVMVEYNRGMPSALVEYKHRAARDPDTNHATYRALIALAERYQDGPLPCFIAFYDPDVWMFRVIPLNDAARRHYGHCAGEWISEQRFVKSLYLLRRATLTADDDLVIATLHS